MSHNPVHNEFNEADLVARLKRREKEAMAELYDRYSRSLYGIIYRLLQSPELAEDILQDCFIQIWERIDQFDQEKGTLFTWMNTVVRNRSLDVLKSRGHRDEKKNRSLEEVVHTIERENMISYNPETIGLKETVGRLDPELQQVIETLYYQGFTQSEAAEELHLPLGTVKTRARRAISELREQLERKNI